MRTLGDLHNVLKCTVVKSPEDIGPFGKAFYEYFLSIDVRPGESLEDAILRSETFEKWKNSYVEEPDLDTDEELVSRFLDQVHLTNYDIKEILSGREILDKNEAGQEDEDESREDIDGVEERNLDRMADYSDVSLEELLDRLEKIRDQQRTEHGGGDHWIGTGGISAYGHGGGAKDGIRLGGTGGGRMARKVMADPNYYPVDKDRLLSDNNVDAALAGIKGVIEESAYEKLDIPKTISHGVKRGGMFLPELGSEKEEDLKVIVMIDNGGYSMAPYIRAVQDLFKKMKTRFAHDLEVFYFHNTVYNVVYTDERRRNRLTIPRLMKYDKQYRVFMIGDAAMAPYELSGESFQTLHAIRNRFKKSVWLNPEPLKYWPMTYTIQAIMQVFPMFPLTPRGIERAVQDMNKSKG